MLKMKKKKKKLVKSYGRPNDSKGSSTAVLEESEPRKWVGWHYGVQRLSIEQLSCFFGKINFVVFF